MGTSPLWPTTHTELWLSRLRYRGKVDSVGRERLLEQARAAHRERRYGAAYRALRSAGESEPLDTDDLHLLADAAWWLGLVNECLSLTEQAHRGFLEAGNVDRAAAQALDLGTVLAMRGEYALASGWLSRARRLLADRPPSPAHGLLAFLDLSQAIEQWRLEEAGPAADDLCRLGKRLGDDTIRALGLLGMGLVQVRRGHVREGFGLLDETMLPVMAGTVAPEWAGHIYCTITSTCLDLADVQRAREWSAAAYRWLDGFPDAVMFDGVCRAHSIYLLSVQGSWGEAVEEAERVAAQLYDLNAAAVAEAEYYRAEIHRVCGRYGQAAASYRRAESLGRDPQPGEALLRLARGDRDGSWTAVTDAVTRASGDSFRCVRALRAQVEIGVATGRVESAAGAAARLREAADRYRTAGFCAWADGAEGQVRLAAGRLDQAAAALGRAAEGYRSLRAWYDLAVVEAWLAVVCRRLGAEDVARRHRDAADAGFHRLEVAPPVTLPSPETRPPGGLTAREAEVLGQVAGGASNRDAALALSVSEATIRRHLANVYGKLGVGSRTAAAAWAHEHGLVPVSASDRRGAVHHSDHPPAHR